MTADSTNLTKLIPRYREIVASVPCTGNGPMENEYRASLRSSASRITKRSRGDTRASDSGTKRRGRRRSRLARAGLPCRFPTERSCIRRPLKSAFSSGVFSIISLRLVFARLLSSPSLLSDLSPTSSLKNDVFLHVPRASFISVSFWLTRDISDHVGKNDGRIFIPSDPRSTQWKFRIVDLLSWKKFLLKTRYISILLSCTLPALGDLFPERARCLNTRGELNCSIMCLSTRPLFALITRLLYSKTADKKADNVFPREFIENNDTWFVVGYCRDPLKLSFFYPALLLQLLSFILASH